MSSVFLALTVALRIDPDDREILQRLVRRVPRPVGRVLGAAERKQHTDR